jgi:uncharacterized oligopeptide transporter (OPT) family protein
VQFINNPNVCFYGIGIVCVFTIWLLWKIFKTANSIDASVKELVKGAQKPQS